MKNIGKIVKNAKAGLNRLDDELLAFLRSYQATTHSSTGLPPNELLFKTSSSTTKMPILRKPQEIAPEITNDALAKENMRALGNSNLHVRFSDLAVEDLVLLRKTKTHKDSTTY